VVIKALFRWLTSEGKIPHDSFATVKLGKASRKVPEPFSDDEVGALLKATRHTQKPQRDKTILLLPLDSALRVSELAGLRGRMHPLQEWHRRSQGAGERKQGAPGSYRQRSYKRATKIPGR